jgi:hypothetical protein
MQLIPICRLKKAQVASKFLTIVNTKGLPMVLVQGRQVNSPDVRRGFNMNVQRREVFSIADASNVNIACVEGSIWITLDNDLRDILLDSGGVFTTLDHRRAVVYALAPSRVCISAAASSQPHSVKSERDIPLKLQMQMQMQSA